jgi:hypothetical protein
MAFSLDVPPQSIAASSAANGAGVDMAGWDGVMFVLALGAIDGTQDMKAQSDDNSGFSSATDITGAAITQVAATGDNKLYILDVYRPGERYVRSVVTNGAGATADFQAVIAIRYRGSGRFPLTQHADVGELKKVAAN